MKNKQSSLASGNWQVNLRLLGTFVLYRSFVWIKRFTELKKSNAAGAKKSFSGGEAQQYDVREKLKWT